MDSSVEITPEIKTDWNNFQTHLDGDYPTAGALSEFNGKNPKSQLTEEHIPAALNYISSIKQNPDIQGLTPAYKSGNNMRFPVTAEGKHPDLGSDPTAIPKPDYADPKSRNQYAQSFTKKYGEYAHGRGDFPLRLNEKPSYASDTAENISVKAAQPLGLDPALLYTSAMEEGMAGLFKDQVDYSDNKDYPTPGFESFGIDYFRSKVPNLIKKGYLPKDFSTQFTPHDQINEQGKVVDSADFKSTEAALQAKAALMRDFRDQTDEVAKKNNITLTPKQRDFMTLVAYNSSSSTMPKMMKEYKEKGFLTDDKIDKDPTGHWTTVTKHIAPRIVIRDALKKEGNFRNIRN